MNQLQVSAANTIVFIDRTVPDYEWLATYVAQNLIAQDLKKVGAGDKNAADIMRLFHLRQALSQD